ncbi:hypothetical protein ACHAWF_006223 [Thalassiosira exigua]
MVAATGAPPHQRRPDVAAPAEDASRKRPPEGAPGEEGARQRPRAAPPPGVFAPTVPPLVPPLALGPPVAPAAPLVASPTAAETLPYLPVPSPAPAAAAGAAESAGLSAASPSRVQEAADGIIRMWAAAPPTQQQPQPHPRVPPVIGGVVGAREGLEISSASGSVAKAGLSGVPAAAAVPPAAAMAAANAPSVAPAAAVAPYVAPIVPTAPPRSLYDSAVRLSITTSRPSYVEPWRKFSPESHTATGVLVPWTEEATTAGDGAAAGASRPAGKDGRKRGVRILTTARAVEHAASVRARSRRSPTSAGCRVEWIGLAMDLALLAVDASDQWDAFPLGVGTGLPRLGEEVACVRYSTRASAGDATKHFGRDSEAISSFSRAHTVDGSDLDVRRGAVAGYHADDECRYLLRMRLDLPPSSSDSSDEHCGGVALDASGRIAGLVASSPRNHSRMRSVIPAPVLTQFLGMCARGNKPCAAHPCHHGHTDGEECTSATSTGHASYDTGDEMYHTEHGGGGCHNHHKGCDGEETGGSSVGLRHLPGVSALGIVDRQTLESGPLRRSLGLMAEGDERGVRILGTCQGAQHSPPATSQAVGAEDRDRGNEGKSTSALRADDVILAINGEPVRLDGSVSLAPGREDERVDFRWLASRQPVGSVAELDILRHKEQIRVQFPLSAPRKLVPRMDEGGTPPSHAICGGCVFVPLTEHWLAEKMAQSLDPGERRELEGFGRYLQEHRRGDQQVIILSHVLADEANVGYHGLRNLVLSSVNGQKPIENMSRLMDILVKRLTMENGSTLEFKCSHSYLDRAKAVICLDTRQVLDSEARILGNYGIAAWCSNALSLALRREAEGKAHRHGVACCLKTMKALRSAVRETTLLVQRAPGPTVTCGHQAAAARAAEECAVAATRRIMDWSEAHKMQSAPLFAGKYTEESGWTQVKTKHLSQLCTCGKSTRFYCICSVGVMRCKDCFIQHCRDHSNQHQCTDTCAPDCARGTDVLAHGVELVTTKKRKRNNPTQAIQSRCVVCKAKTCYCCSACGFENEVALCHVSTGRNCLPMHASSHHSDCGHTHHH